MAFSYHLSLWLANLLAFLILDFSKRVNDLLYGLTLPELAVNAGVVLLVGSPLAIALALASLGIERVAGMRPVHALAIFLIITINLWSLKISSAYKLESVTPGTREVMAVSALVLVLAASWLLARRLPARSQVWQARAVAIIVVWVTLMVLGLGAALLPHRSQEPKTAIDRPNVILVTIDSFSAKHTNLFGYDRNTTPNLAAFASQSVVLERMHSNFNVTGLALPSLMGYFSNSRRGETLPECLRDAGYQTAFFSFWAPELFFLHGFSHFELSRSAMQSPLYRSLSGHFSEAELRWLAGLGTQEWSYFNPYLSEYHDDIFWRTLHYPPQLSLDAALAYLKEHPRGAFVWVHLWPPHFPYLPEPDTREMFGPGPREMKPWINVVYDKDQDAYVASLKNLYDQCVFGVDRRLGAFLDALKSQGLYESSYIIVGADHGESFERGWVGHSGWPLMEAITHIPFVIHRPGDTRQIRVQTLAQQLDFAPTVLDLLGLPIPKAMPGESLLPYIEHPERLSERYKVSVSLLASTGEGGQLAVYWRTFKLMFLSNDHGVYRLYDLFKDPDAVNDLGPREPRLVEEMMKRLVLPSAGP